VPKDVAGRELGAFRLSRAVKGFGRASDDDAGGRIPLPTLAEKMDGVVAEDMDREKLVLFRCEYEEGCCEFIVDITAALTGAWDFGVGSDGFEGCPALSASVCLFAPDSGTVLRSALPLLLNVYSNSQFEP
jgi:hypothetical protein